MRIATYRCRWVNAFKDFDGNVLIDDVPIGNYTLHSLRSQTGILFSRQDIFRGSLLENITMGNASVSIDEVTNLANITGLIEFIQSQKEGYDTTNFGMAGLRLAKNTKSSSEITPPAADTTQMINCAELSCTRATCSSVRSLASSCSGLL